MKIQHIFVRRWLWLLLIHCIVKTDQSNDQSHTFFVPRQITTNDVFELALNNYHWYHEREIDNCVYYGIYAKPFFQQSVNRDEIAEYFFRHNNQRLTFREINENPNDIESLWFGLQADVNTNFNGTLNMKPRRTTYGSYFNFYVTKGFNCHHIWFNMACALMHAKHDLHLSEQIQEEPGPLSNFSIGTINQFASIIAALNNPAWNFGKFKQVKLNRTGLDDIQVKLGYDWFYDPKYNNHVSPYLVTTIPTGKRQRSECIFEPLVGSKNGSLGFGVLADYTHCICKNYFTYLFDFKYRYVFNARQYRSYDLRVNGDWSRYLLVVPENQHLATQPGINLFSLPSDVSPRSTINIWAALHWQRCDYNLEFGYNFWWRQKEKVSPQKRLESGFGIFDLAGMNGVPQSASQANISQGPIGPNQAPSDPTFIEVTLSDLDRSSAAHPKALSSTLYGAFGWQPHFCGYALLLGIGGQYEFAHRRSALEQWALWASLGLIF